MVELETKNLSEKFNKIRLDNLNKELSSYEIKSLLSAHNIPSLMLYSFVKANCIYYKGNKVNRKYFFSKDPIYVTKIKKAIHFYKNTCEKYKNNKNKTSIEQAIKLLKSNNYKIQKPVCLNYDKLKNIMGDKIYDFIDYEDC